MKHLTGPHWKESREKDYYTTYIWDSEIKGTFDGDITPKQKANNTK
jgi:hypothetical protein